jgi:hypothetical protein
MPLSDDELKTFNALSQFISALGETFAKKDHHLALYSRLIEKTTLKHEDGIRRHINVFRTFYNRNKDGILSRNLDIFESSKIKFSDRVYINIKKVFNYAKDDKETTEVIWQHLLTLSAFIDPTGGAQKVLREELPNFGDSNEGNFLNKMVGDLQTQVDPNETNPMNAVMKLMQSGYVTKLAQEIGSGMQDGNFDMGKMFGSLQQVMGGSSTGPDSSEEKKDGGSAPMPDLSQMMGGMMNMFGGNAGGNNNLLAQERERINQDKKDDQQSDKDSNTEKK